MKFTQKITLCALFAALMAASAWIRVPSVPPFTLQTYVLFLSVGLLGTKGALMSTAAYLALGAAGLPVFSGGGGVGALLSASGGYLIGFLPAAAVSGAVISRFGKGKAVMAVAFFAGLAVCYAFGSLWYYVFYIGRSGGIGIGAILLQCVLPFIPFDALKIALAVFSCKRLGKVLQKYEV